MKKSPCDKACEEYILTSRRLRSSRSDPLAAVFRMRLWAMCLILRINWWHVIGSTRHALSRNTMPITRSKFFSIDRWLRAVGPKRLPSKTSELMLKRIMEGR